VTWRLALVAVAVVALVLPGRILASEHADDDALTPYAGVRLPARAVPGQTVHVDAGVRAADPAPIELVEVRPRIAVDTTSADITIRVCTLAGHGDFAVANGPDGQSCRTLADVTGARARLRPGDQQLVVTVTPRHTGRLEVDGFDVTYVESGRRGTEHAGEGFRLRVA
jgi:hypothetical protein